MPRRSLDKGGKPFEFRAGVGGLPKLGGMFRSGDPVVTPPQKFHVLVNMRVTPGGTITRPGLALEFNTGVQECINGLTEDAGDQGGALMLYPGAESRPGNGTPSFNPVTFRAIFPDSSIDYSEFAFAVYGPAAAVRGNQSPILAYASLGGAYFGPPWLSRPFIFRGQAVQFAMVPRGTIDTVALLGINLAQRSFLQASDCWRDTARPNDGTTPSCPGAAGQPTPPAINDPPLWPFQHPIGSVGVLAYFDHPFPDTTIAWQPDASSAADDIVVDQILTRPERVDDVLTGTSGVSEVLYFVARQDVGGIRKRKLIRWDGAIQSTEAVTIPDDLGVGLGGQRYGPSLMELVQGGDFTGAAAVGTYTACRGPSGSWQIGAVTNIGNFVSGGPEFFGRVVSWGGASYAVLYGTYLCGVVSDGPFVFLFRQDPETANVVLDISVGVAIQLFAAFCELAVTVEPLDVVVSGPRCYGIIDGGGALCVASFNTGLQLHSIVGGIPLGGVNPWIQVIGDRVYVGGKFAYNPATQAADVDHHGVYDVTDQEAIFAVYRVTETEQLEDSGEGGHQVERYSRGALPAVPNDDTGGEGFQPS